MVVSALVDELLKTHQYLSAIEVVEQQLAAHPNGVLHRNKLDEVIRLTRACPIARKAFASKQGKLPRLEEMKIGLVRNSNKIREATWNKQLKTEIQKAFERMRTKPLTCGTGIDRPKSPAWIEGGRRLAGIEAKNDQRLPLVSVVTVCLNAEDGIEKALQSVQSQSYENVEHVVVDGGSTDSTIPILRKHEDRLAYFVSAKDNGIYSAMNKGLRLARGEYITLLNADDRFHPEFISSSLQSLLNFSADISFCDYETENGTVRVLYPNEGILFSQLNIKHNTFLCHRRCFERVGGFDETRKYVSDARWIRTAFLLGLKFVKTNGAFVFYSTAGASSSQTDAIKAQIIRESGSLLRLCFPFLDSREGEGLYRSNFNLHFHEDLTKIYQRPGIPYLFRKGLREFVLFNLREREVYKLNVRKPNTVKLIVELASSLEIPFTILSSKHEPCPLRRILSRTEFLSRKARALGADVVLHFARRFSSPSETFIHELICDLSRRDKGKLHVMLCDERLLVLERPYEDVLEIPWEKLPRELRSFVYGLMWDRLSPRLIVTHFALNGYWLYERLTDEQRQTPSVFMSHGVDVFAISKGGDYADFMMNTALFSSNILLTAVSEFLRNELIELGFPGWKVHLLPNSVSGLFFEHRKTDGFYRGDRPLEIVSIGRLIQWKGHEHLIKAVADIDRLDSVPARLTVVYGNFDQELDRLRSLAKKLGVDEKISWIPFVDFQSESDYLGRFDLFVLPSTFSERTGAQTETFGVSMLEAICAGLPVIGSDVGGIPEVVGDGSRFSRIVAHGESESIRQAILDLVKNPEIAFSDNMSFATERMEYFSQDQRFSRWQAVLDNLFAERRTIYHFCALGRGGAAGATINIHKGFLRHRWSSYFVTRAQEKPRIPKHTPNVIYIEPEYSCDFQQVQPDKSRPGLTIFSIDDHAVSNETLLKLVADANILNLSWIARFLSVDNVAALSSAGPPVLITLRDMYSITGGCHYFHGCKQWKSDCAACPQIIDVDDEYPQIVLQSKMESWNWDNITFVALSDHSVNILKTAAVSRGRAIQKVPNYVDRSAFFRDEAVSRDTVLGEARGFVIGYLPSFNSEAKGHPQFVEALRILHERHPDIELSVAWASPEWGHEKEVPFEVIRLSHMKEKAQLRAFYNAVDIVAVPSLEETFSNTTVEALACGSPVVGFQTGVLAELPKEPKISGIVALGDCEALAEEILGFYRNGVNPDACEEFVQTHFDHERVMTRYLDVVSQSTSAKSEPLGNGFSSGSKSSLEELRKRMAVRKAVEARKRLSELRRRLTKAR